MNLFELNSGWFDTWTLVHAVLPFVIFLVISRFTNPIVAVLLTVIVVVLWEIWEISNHPNGFGGSESAINFIMDLFVGALAIAVAWYVVRVASDA